MTDTWTGRCACGAVTVEATGDPVAQLHCQCRQCQHRSGTGHASFVVFAGEGTVRIEGNTTSFTATGDSGNDKHQAFCPVCGTPTHVTFPAMPGVTAISPAMLDAPDRFVPAFVTYGVAAQPWDRMDPGLTVFDRLPPG